MHVFRQYRPQMCHKVILAEATILKVSMILASVKFLQPVALILYMCYCLLASFLSFSSFEMVFVFFYPDSIVAMFPRSAFFWYYEWILNTGSNSSSGLIPSMGGSSSPIVSSFQFVIPCSKNHNAGLAMT
jgi:hypothetical protein